MGQEYEKDTKKSEFATLNVEIVDINSKSWYEYYIKKSQDLYKNSIIEKDMIETVSHIKEYYNKQFIKENKDLIKKNVPVVLISVNNIRDDCIDSPLFKITGNTGYMIPVYVKTNGRLGYESRWQYRFKNITCNPLISDANNCDWLWYDILFDSWLTGIFNFRICDSVISMLCIPNHYGTSRYISIDEKIKDLPNKIKYIAYKHMIGKFNLDYYNKGSWLDIVNINSNKKISINNACVNKETTLIYYKNAPIPPMFADHQIFVDDNVIRNMEKLNEYNYIFPLINLGKNVSKLLIYGLIIYLPQLPKYLLTLLKLTGILDADSDEEFVKIGKIVSDNAKSLHNITNIETKLLFEIHTLVNRTVTPINWNNEYRHRVKPNLTRIPPEFVYHKAFEIFSESRYIRRNFKYKKRTWERFWEERAEWGTTGAFFSEFAEDAEHMADIDKDFRNKFYYFITLPNELKLDHYICRPAATNATVSIKYEWCKQRAIYGTDVTNYVMTQFVMQNCEELLTRDLAIGNNSTEEIVRTKVEYILDNKEPFCLDFEDFNSQHSITNMRAVVLAYIHVWMDRMSPDQRLAANWLLESINKQIVHDSIGLKDTYQTKGTLLSGWRLTSFINTILNKVYFKFLQGGLEFEHNSIHSGDDIMVGIRSLREVQVIYKRCKWYNVRLSPLKCFVGSVAEFLRVDHRCWETGQYLARGIATLVAGKIESKPAFNVRDVFEAILTRCNSAIKRRGNVKIITDLQVSQLEKQRKKFGVSKKAQDLIIKCNRIQGGISDNYEVLPYRIKFILEDEEARKELKKRKTTPGIFTYVKRCVEILPTKQMLLPLIAKYVQEKVDMAFLRRPNQLVISRLNKKDYEKERLLLGHKGTFAKYMERIPEYGKIRVIGQTLEMFKTIRSSDNLGLMLATSSNPIRLLTVVTSSK